jgi:glutaredoxin 2
MITLYHYVHCPFCLRVRFAFGLLGIQYHSIVVPYSDEESLIALTGKKMLPIITDQDGAMNESLDIINKFDKENKLSIDFDMANLDSFLSKLGSPIHNLCMPYWIYTKEFDQNNREYFQKKKEIKRGPFNKLIQDQEKYLNELRPLLKELEESLTPFYNSKEISLADICIASHIWGLYVFPEFQFSTKVNDYLQSVKTLCHFNYHQDLWKVN